ncbi:response regulator transcription factor [Helicobacter sp. MIT 14-3879]|uniref:response regulator transcription factor n=1 Tax=Helicobacter sp. MIT 14-3879 TaxID=2040649 RepID=UPI000E1F5CF2|nr:response regulator transcription factor [Helicobacter sp. MIT 14-3879]RDU61306.1 DNA-binding response regulator [Helicobacter sp. MIT 14-3879]
MVYILEDDKYILELLIYALKSQDIQAQGFDNPNDFQVAINNHIPKILILDLMLPHRNGFEILKSLKNNPKTKQVVVLVLSALNNEMDKVKGLDLGADDYITKPFSVMEFLARIRVILRRFETEEENIYIDDLEFSTLEHSVKLQGKEIKLTLKEFDLLGFLLKNPNRAFSRDSLLEILWGYDYTGESRTIDMHIKTLRQKLGKWGDKIKTVHGMGYKLKSK